MDYPEMHIGPEPTTDRFIAVVHGNDVKTIQGNAVTGVNDLPFSGLSTFGSSFLNKFNAAVVPASLLENITIIDTPGVLSGEIHIFIPLSSYYHHHHHNYHHYHHHLSYHVTIHHNHYHDHYHYYCNHLDHLYQVKNKEHLVVMIFQKLLDGLLKDQI